MELPYVNLAQAPDDNLGGLQAIWYTPAASILGFPSRGPLAIEQLALRPGCFWYQLVSVRDSVKLTDSPKAMGRHGQAHVHKLVGALARHTPGLAAGLETMEGGRFVALVRDQNGAVQLVGSPECPLQWQDTFSSGSETQRNGYDWVLQGEALRRCRPYRGSWQVSSRGLDEGVVLQPPGPGTGAEGSVELRTAGGRLLAVVPAGRSIVLNSGFKLGWRIE